MSNLSYFLQGLWNVGATVRISLSQEKVNLTIGYIAVSTATACNIRGNRRLGGPAKITIEKIGHLIIEIDDRYIYWLSISKNEWLFFCNILFLTSNWQCLTPPNMNQTATRGFANSLAIF